MIAGVILLIALTSLCVIPSVLAKSETSAFVSGFNYGVQDASQPINSIHGFPPGPLYNGTYINQTGKGFDHHSASFDQGYIRGWCESRINGTLYPNSKSWEPDIRCSGPGGTLGTSIILTK